MPSNLPFASSNRLRCDRRGSSSDDVTRSIFAEGLARNCNPNTFVATEDVEREKCAFYN
jgi:hypothetical protein